MMPRLPIPADSDEFAEETREGMRHILKTRTTVPPPSSYLTYAGKAGARKAVTKFFPDIGPVFLGGTGPRA